MVRRRVSADDFKGAEGARRPDEMEDVWWVCEGYEIRGDKIVAKYPAVSFGDTRYYPPSQGYTLDKGWRGYRPLLEAPDLFLKFARLYEESDFERAALAWSHRYGILGGCVSGGRRCGKRPDWMYLEVFWEEARKAWAVLKMYEAALNRDPQAVRRLLASYRDEEADYLLAMGVNEDTPLGFYKNELQLALYSAIRLVQQEVEWSCDKWLVIEGDDDTPDPSQVKQIQGFDNLLRAMYLQMHWLITSGGNVTRCEHCGRVISLSRPHPEGRKRRRDKRFCDDACRQAHHRSKKKTQDADLI